MIIIIGAIILLGLILLALITVFAIIFFYQDEYKKIIEDSDSFNHLG